MWLFLFHPLADLLHLSFPLFLDRRFNFYYYGGVYVTPLSSFDQQFQCQLCGDPFVVFMHGQTLRISHWIKTTCVSAVNFYVQNKCFSVLPSFFRRKSKLKWRPLVFKTLKFVYFNNQCPFVTFFLKSGNQSNLKWGYQHIWK